MTDERITCDRCGRSFATGDALGGHVQNAHIRAYKRKGLVEHLLRVATDLGRAPTAAEMDEQDGPTSSVYQRVFGSWREALNTTGLKPTYQCDQCGETFQRGGKLGGHKISHQRGPNREELIADLQRVADTLDHRPRKKDMDEHGTWSAETYANHFDGSFRNALRAADLPTYDKIDRRIRDEQLLAEVHRLETDLTRPPTYANFQELADHSAWSASRRFGSFPALIREAGYPHTGDRGEIRVPFSGPNHPNWDGGHERTERHGPKWNSEIKETVRERDGYLCQDPGCDLTQEQHRELYDGKALHVHHLRDPDAFAQKSEAHKPPNLITLCAVHHPKWEALQPLAPDGHRKID